MASIVIFFLIQIPLWNLVEILYRLSIGIGPFDDLTGFDFFLVPLHFVGLAVGIFLQMVVMASIRRILKRIDDESEENNDDYDDG
jgi:hypothetical protein